MAKHRNETYVKTITPYSRTWDTILEEQKVTSAIRKIEFSHLVNTDAGMEGASCAHVDLHAACHLGREWWREI